MIVLSHHIGGDSGNNNIFKKSRHNYQWLISVDYQYLIIVYMISECVSYYTLQMRLLSTYTALKTQILKIHYTVSKAQYKVLSTFLTIY